MVLSQPNNLMEWGVSGSPDRISVDSAGMVWWADMADDSVNRLNPSTNQRQRYPLASGSDPGVVLRNPTSASQS
jgi:streptogramin lyase